MDNPLIIPFFIPHAGCPFTCAFCNQYEITGRDKIITPEEIAPQVENYLKHAKNSSRRVEIAFYGGSFTGLPIDFQVKLLTVAAQIKKNGDIQGIRLSTRPDYISNEILQMLQVYGVTTIELGVQSLSDEILANSQRGHTVDDTMLATKLIRQYPFELVYQLMLGLPGDNPVSALKTAEKTVQARPDYTRIYPTLVLKGTQLAQWYLQGEFKPWSLEQTIEVAAQWLGIFSLYQIPVIRLGLQATENLTYEKDLLAGPYHPAFGELVKSSLMYQQAIFLLEKERDRLTAQITLLFNPRDYSLITGQKRHNISKLKLQFGLTDIILEPAETMKRNDLAVKMGGTVRMISRQEFLEIYRIRKEEPIGKDVE